MRTGQKGLDLIKAEEGFRSKMYICPAGYPTIGYGTVIDTKEEDYLKYTQITPIEAEGLLKKDLEIFERAINQLVRVRINQDQFDALASFVYNLGPDNFRKSTLLRLINQNPSDPTIWKEFQKWVHAGGKKLPGLVRRREREANLYFSKEQ